MAVQLASVSGPACDLILVPNLTHSEPMYQPQAIYWSIITNRL